jgi:hypothetical protein
MIKINSFNLTTNFSMLTLKPEKIEVTEIYLELVYHLYKKNGFREMKDEKQQGKQKRLL